MVDHKIEAAAIKSAIEKAARILLVAHKRPDADTVGCVGVWYHLLSAKGKEVTAFCVDEVPLNLRYMPGSQYVSSDVNLLRQPFDAIIVNDSGDLEYAGIDSFIPSRDATGATLVNIDHHVTNPHYGDVNLVIDTASSTTEILARLFLHWEETITKPMAENLLNGIITDTDNLTNPATTYQSLVIASELVRAGADLHAIIQRILSSKSVVDLKLWGLALSRLKRSSRYGVIVTYITSEDIEELNMSVDSLEGIANYLTLIPDVNIVLVLQGLDNGFLKGSLRTIKPQVDVGNLALRLGGGGHRRASGFRVKGRLDINDNSWTII